MTAAPILWLWISSLVYPGHVSCCLEIRDSFPDVVQHKCPYFPADKRNLQVILACVQFSVERYICILVLNQWAYICFYYSTCLFWESQIIFSRVTCFLKKYFLNSKVNYSHKSHKNYPNTILCYSTTGKV